MQDFFAEYRRFLSTARGTEVTEHNLHHPMLSSREIEWPFSTIYCIKSVGALAVQSVDRSIGGISDEKNDARDPVCLCRCFARSIRLTTKCVYSRSDHVGPAAAFCRAPSKTVRAGRQSHGEFRRLHHSPQNACRIQNRTPLASHPRKCDRHFRQLQGGHG